MISAQMQGLQLNEQLQYIKPDGTRYRLHAPPSTVVLSTEGFGTPPLEYIVDRSPFQHGNTVRNMLLLPRPVQVVVMQNFCSRADYWSGRASLLNAIRPNRVTDYNSPGKLLYLLPNRVKRQLDVLLDDGPGFQPPQQGWRAWSFTEVLRFTAHDPVWYDPTLQSVVFDAAASSLDELEFPATFPIQFSTFGGSTSIQYDGTWLDYPTIVLTGPITSPVITNQSTGDEIGLDYAIASGETVTITLRGIKTIVNNSGDNLLYTLTAESDLTTFGIYPDPQAAGGVNTISVSGSGTDANSTVTVQYYNRYIGI
jgi:hypothetical protein